jgi:hypothetical protein
VEGHPHPWANAVAVAQQAADIAYRTVWSGQVNPGDALTLLALPVAPWAGVFEPRLIRALVEELMLARTDRHAPFGRLLGAFLDAATRLTPAACVRACEALEDRLVGAPHDARAYPLMVLMLVRQAPAATEAHQRALSTRYAAAIG